MTATAVRAETLRLNRAFVTLWVGQAVSELGTQVTTFVLPLLAVTVMAANTVEVGVLRACASIAVLLASIPAGVIVDRSRKRVVMLVANVGRTLFLASIPAFWFFHMLTIGQLYVVAFLTGVLTIAFTVAYHAYYPMLVDRAKRAELRLMQQQVNSACVYRRRLRMSDIGCE